MENSRIKFVIVSITSFLVLFLGNLSSQEEIPSERPIVSYNTNVWDNKEVAQLAHAIQSENSIKAKLSTLNGFLKREPKIFDSKQIVQVLTAFREYQMIDALKTIENKISELNYQELSEILEMFKTDKSKLQALEILKSRIKISEEKDVILKKFKKADNRNKALKILTSIQAINPLFGRIKEKNVIFVIDTSESMSTTFEREDGMIVTRLEYVIQELTSVINNLDKNSNFNIVTFSSYAIPWQPVLISATKEHIASAINYLNGLKASGPTNLHDGLTIALADETSNTIYLLTDGIPTTGLSSSSSKELKATLSKAYERRRNKNFIIHTIAFIMGDTNVVFNYTEDKSEAKKLMYVIAKLFGGIYKVIE
ncbi:MAG: VWA domain-containing protein [Leptospiraceae bacterium]|nr:VWA domain-containing protein [Leptospiraceae bacterium]